MAAYQTDTMQLIPPLLSLLVKCYVYGVIPVTCYLLRALRMCGNPLKNKKYLLILYLWQVPFAITDDMTHLCMRNAGYCMADEWSHLCYCMADEWPHLCYCMADEWPHLCYCMADEWPHLCYNRYRFLHNRWWTPFLL